MTETLKVDITRFTVGDIEDFEDISGESFTRLAQRMAKPKSGNVDLSTKALKALIFIVKRHDDPEFTLEKAREVRIATLELETNGQRPTQAAPAANHKTRRTRS